MSAPYRVEREERGCETCGHGAEYSIVLAVPGQEEVQLSESFSERNPIAESAKEHAEDLVENLNAAYEEGRKSRVALLNCLKEAMDRYQRGSTLAGEVAWIQSAMEAIKEDELAS